MMDAFWSSERQALWQKAVEFAQRELTDDLAERDRQGVFSLEHWRKCARFGVPGLTMPRRYGGQELDLPGAVATLEGLGYGCRDNGLLFGLGAQMWAVQTPLVALGTDAQKERFLPALIDGRSIGAFSATEPEAGSDIFSLRATAVRDGTGYVLNGHKIYITNAPVANVFLVIATVDPAQERRGLTGFLIERETPGLSVEAPLNQMGLRTAAIGVVKLDNCRVEADAMLGKLGAGAALFGVAMEWERTLILAPVLGLMQRQLEECVRYARTRRQFGRPIGDNQLISSKLAEMQLRWETSQLLLYKAAWMKQTGQRLLHQPSAVKLHLSESWVRNCEDAMQIHGARGYQVESGIERDLRDALASRIFSGTSEIHKVIIADCLGA